MSAFKLCQHSENSEMKFVIVALGFQGFGKLADPLYMFRFDHGQPIPKRAETVKGEMGVEVLSQRRVRRFTPGAPFCFFNVNNSVSELYPQ